MSNPLGEVTWEDVLRARDEADSEGYARGYVSGFCEGLRYPKQGDSSD